MSPVDWRIIDALVDDPTMPFEALTEKTGLSPKTVRKHLLSLIRNETIYVMPRLVSLAHSAAVAYHLALTGKFSLSELRHTLGAAQLLSHTRHPPTKYLLCRSNALADVTSRTQP